VLVRTGAAVTARTDWDGVAVGVGVGFGAGVDRAVTVMLAVAARPGSLWVEVMALVVLAWTPGATPTTSTAKVHAAPAASVSPAIETTLAPAAAVMVPQLPTMLFGVAIARPAGSGSVKLMFVRDPRRSAGPASSVGTVLGLVIVKVSDVVPSTGIDAAPKAMATVGGAAVAAARNVW
jgi:hypothetical protein